MRPNYSEGIGLKLYEYNTYPKKDKKLMNTILIENNYNLEESLEKVSEMLLEKYDDILNADEFVRYYDDCKNYVKEQIKINNQIQLNDCTATSLKPISSAHRQH